MVDLHRGVSYNKNEGHSIKEENDCLVMRGGNILEGAIDIEADNIYVDKSLVKSEQYIKENDIIIVSSTGSTKVIGRAGILYADYDDVAFGAFLTLVRPKGKIYKRYIDYYFQSQIYRERIRSLASGVNINNIRAEYITNLPIPIPPLVEQQRIVERIESLFFKLAEARDKVLGVMEACEVRKKNLLNRIFNGLLITQWDLKHNVKIREDLYLFEECIEKMQNGLAKRNGNVGKEYVVIRLANLSDNGFVTDDLRMILLDEKEQQTYRLNQNDVVMIRVNGSKDNVAKQIIIENNVDWAFCDHIIRIKYNESKVLPKFMVYYSKSQYYRDYVRNNMVSSAGQNTISRKGMANLVVPKFTLDEQNRIVNFLDEFLEKENDIQRKCKIVIEQIELIKKSILAKAFHGELGTNNPEEESAIELLKKILE